MTDPKIIKNAIKCRKCGDVIESTHTHDFRWCSCETVAVDGGRSYLKRCFKNSPDDFEEMSEYETGDAEYGDKLDQKRLWRSDTI